MLQDCESYCSQSEACYARIVRAARNPRLCSDCERDGSIVVGVTSHLGWELSCSFLFVVAVSPRKCRIASVSAHNRTEMLRLRGVLLTQKHNHGPKTHKLRQSRREKQQLTILRLEDESEAGSIQPSNLSLDGLATMPSLTVKYGQRAATLPLPPTVGALRVAIRAEFGLPAEGGALTLISRVQPRPAPVAVPPARRPPPPPAPARRRAATPRPSRWRTDAGRPRGSAAVRAPGVGWFRLRPLRGGTRRRDAQPG